MGLEPGPLRRATILQVGGHISVIILIVVPMGVLITNASIHRQLLRLGAMSIFSLMADVFALAVTQSSIVKVLVAGVVRPTRPTRPTRLTALSTTATSATRPTVPTCRPQLRQMKKLRQRQHHRRPATSTTAASPMKKF